MKNIFTLLFTTAMLNSAFAQYYQRNQRDQKGYDNSSDIIMNEGSHGYDKHDDKFKGGFYFTEREKDMQIAQVNCEYDYKISSVRNQLFMGRYQKIRQVRVLKE